MVRSQVQWSIIFIVVVVAVFFFFAQILLHCRQPTNQPTRQAACLTVPSEFRMSVAGNAFVCDCRRCMEEMAGRPLSFAVAGKGSGDPCSVKAEEGKKHVFLGGIK